MNDALRSIVAANRAGKSRGIASWCTAHPDVLRVILREHRQVAGPILIEATCNQVNHRGGYTGMAPMDFRRFVEALAREAQVDPGRIVLGGDHLGPNPWKHLPAAEAMAEASAMVRAYAEAGFGKIHLDASMACGDDARLCGETMADRAAELCAVAEAASASPPCYVIGTEVPMPGGEMEALDTLAVTRPEAVHQTFTVHAAAFDAKGVGAAFERVIALVVQPGVDFGNEQVFAFEPTLAANLRKSVSELPGAVFEAHSTDYQTGAALAGLVASHFAILKVGPELTFAYREALFGLAAIEDALGVAAASKLADAVDRVMVEDDKHWRSYLPRGGGERLLRLFGLSDRVRYYWTNPRLAEAVAKLRRNIDGAHVPPGLVAQYAGGLERSSAASPLSERAIAAKIGVVVRKYLSACGSG